MRNPGLLLAVMFAVLLACRDRAAAQQYRGRAPDPHTLAFATAPPPAPGPSLFLPRLELASGLVIMLASVPAALFVLLSTMSFDEYCYDSYDEPSPELEACVSKEEKQNDRAQRASVATGVVVAAVGIGIALHGGTRIGRTKAERRKALALLRPTAWSVQPLPQRATASIQWRF